MKNGGILILAAARSSRAAKAPRPEEMRGDVWLHREKVFTRLPGPAAPSPGDKIKLGRKPAARLAFSDGSSAPVDAKAWERVGAPSRGSFKAAFCDPPLFCAPPTRRGCGDWLVAARGSLASRGAVAVTLCGEGNDAPQRIGPPPPASP